MWHTLGGCLVSLVSLPALVSVCRSLTLFIHHPHILCLQENGIPLARSLFSAEGAAAVRLPARHARRLSGGSRRLSGY